MERLVRIGVFMLLLAAGISLAGCVGLRGRSERPEQPVPPLAELAEVEGEPPYLELTFDTRPSLCELYQPSRVLIWVEPIDHSPEDSRWERELRYPLTSSDPVRMALPDGSWGLLGIAVWATDSSTSDAYPIDQGYYQFPVGGCSWISVKLYPGGVTGMRVYPRRTQGSRPDISRAGYYVDGILIVAGPLHGVEPAILRTVRWGTAEFRPRWPLAVARHVGDNTLANQVHFYSFPPPDPAVAKLTVKRGAKERTIDWSHSDRWGGSGSPSRAFGADTICIYAFTDLDPDEDVDAP